jgi:hypothetical protein
MKFSIRDLLLVTVIVALAVGWWVDHRQLMREVRLFRDPELLKFKAKILEQTLNERGITVEIPRVGTLIITENGVTREINYTW